MKSQVVEKYGRTYLVFMPPGKDTPLRLPIGPYDIVSWSWNGDTEKPTVEPSIISVYDDSIQHYFLKDGICEMLSDTNDGTAGQKIPLIDLPEEWVSK